MSHFASAHLGTPLPVRLLTGKFGGGYALCNRNLVPATYLAQRVKGRDIMGSKNSDEFNQCATVSLYQGNKIVPAATTHRFVLRPDVHLISCYN